MMSLKHGWEFGIKNGIPNFSGIPFFEGTSNWIAHSVKYKPFRQILSRSISLTDPRMPCHDEPRHEPSHEQCHGLRQGLLPLLF